MNRIRRIATGILAGALLVGLAACQSIPSSGPVNESAPVRNDEPIELDFIVQGPQAGATQEEILEGFVLAAASPLNDYQIARQYLTPDFDQEWQPNAGVAIDQGIDDWVTDPLDDDTISVEIIQTAGVTEAGVYAETAAVARPLEYTFEQVDGQWRISSAPQGVLVDEPTFRQIYVRHTLYFYDPTFTYMVPDVRWFVRRDSAQTSIVRALLNGPADWLAPGVVTAFPTGATLANEAVPISSRRASVSLSSDTVPDDVLTLQRMELQLTQSLASIRDIDEVDMTIDGRQENPPAMVSNQPIVNPRIDSQPAVMRDGQFGYLSFITDEIEPIPAISSALEALNPSDVSLGTNLTSAAALTPEGVYSVAQDGTATLIDQRNGLLPPAIDPFGIVWSASTADPGVLRWFAADGSSQVLKMPWTANEKLAAFEVSRDGTRMLAVLNRGTVSTVMVMAIVRSAEFGLPTSVGDPLSSLPLEGTAIDATWLDQTNVGTLIEPPSGGTELHTIELGGLSSEKVGPNEGVAMAGSNLVRDVRVLTSAGDIVVQSGVTWQSRASGIGVLATQLPLTGSN